MLATVASPFRDQQRHATRGHDRTELAHAAKHCVCLLPLGISDVHAPAHQREAPSGGPRARSEL